MGSAWKDTAKYLTKEELDYNQKKNEETGRYGGSLALSYSDLERVDFIKNSLGLKSRSESVRYLLNMMMPLVQDCYKNQAQLMINKLIEKEVNNGY